MPGCRPRWLNSAVPVDCGQRGRCSLAKALTKYRLVIWQGNCSYIGRGNENEKGIVDSGSRADDPGADERAGRRARDGDGWSFVLRWRLLRPVWGSDVRWLLYERQRGNSQAGHQGEGRWILHQWSLRGHHASEQVDVPARGHLQYRDSRSGRRALYGEGLRSRRQDAAPAPRAVIGPTLPRRGPARASRGNLRGCR